MTDPKSELGARFEDRRPDDQNENEEDNEENLNETEATDDMSDTQDPDNTGNAGNTGDTSNKPGPERDENATRHRSQVPMYLPEEKKSELNNLYSRLDGRSKVAGGDGIEKHADFMETLVDIAVDSEDEIAQRLGIE